MSPITRSYVVEGMTCAHCVASVRDEVGELAGVHHVDVDLASGRLTVAADALDDAAVAAAVDEAGYALAPAA